MTLPAFRDSDEIVPLPLELRVAIMFLHVILAAAGSGVCTSVTRAAIWFLQTFFLATFKIPFGHPETT